MTTPPPASAVTCRNERRSSWQRLGVFHGYALLPPLRRVVNGFADAQIGAAAADVAVHRRVDLGVGRRRVAGEERRGGHQLTGLAVAALRHVELQPRLLQRMRAIGGEPFDGRHLPRADRRDGVWQARGRGAVQLHRAGAALADAAAELRPLQLEDVAQHPQQRHFGRDIHRMRPSVYTQRIGHEDAP